MSSCKELAGVKLDGRAMLAALHSDDGRESCERFAQTVERFCRSVDESCSIPGGAKLENNGHSQLVRLRQALQTLSHDAQNYARELAGGE